MEQLGEKLDKIHSASTYVYMCVHAWQRKGHGMMVIFISPQSGSKK